MNSWSFLSNTDEQLQYFHSRIMNLILIFVAFTAVFSIAEIAARESILSMLSGQIANLKSEFVEQNRYSNATVTGRTPNQIAQKSSPKPLPSKLAAASISNSDEILDRSDATIKERSTLLFKINQLEQLKRDLQTMITLGSDNEQLSLRFIQKKFMSITTPETYTEPFYKRDLSKNQFSIFFSESIEDFLRLSSDHLLAISIMACGIIGAMINELRSEKKLMTFRALSLGLTSGFVVYLAIKGGKHVFILQTQGDLVAFNPYGSAFVGLLSGLFTERLHQAMTMIANDFFERLQAASNGKKETKSAISRAPLRQLRNKANAKPTNEKSVQGAAKEL